MHQSASIKSVGECKGDKQVVECWTNLALDDESLPAGTYQKELGWCHLERHVLRLMVM